MRAYGALGAYGLGTPQSNPTVEPEMGILMPRQATLYGTRLTSLEKDPLARLEAYLVNIDKTLETYDSMKMSAFGFACTGSSYLVGRQSEEAITAAAQERFGYPVITAADAIVWGLKRIGAKRIAMIAPYPQALIEAGKAYFEARGVEVVSSERVVTRTTDTRTIYEITPEQADKLLHAAPSDVEALLVSGTGMPSLAALAAYDKRPVLSSNLCLAGRLLAEAGHEDLLDGASPIGWQGRLVEALAPASKEPSL